MKLTEIYNTNGHAAIYRTEHVHRVVVDYDHWATDPREWSEDIICYLLPSRNSQDPRTGAKEAHPLFEMYLNMDYDYVTALESYLGPDEGAEVERIGGLIYDRKLTKVEATNLLYRKLNPGTEERLELVQRASNDQSTGYYSMLIVASPDYPEAGHTADAMTAYFSGDVYTVSCDCGESMGDMHGYGYDTEAAARDFIKYACVFEPSDHMTVGALKEALRDLDDCAAVTVNGQPLNVHRLDIDTDEETVDITDY